MPLSKAQLLREIARFLRDESRGISIRMFCEVCGLSEQHLRDVFIYKKHPLTEEVQIRVNRAYEAWKQGRIKVMKRPDNTRYADYRKEAKPVFMPHMGLKMTPDGIKMSLGMRNRHDYSDAPINEQIKEHTK